jgi:hypothetical protein
MKMFVDMVILLCEAGRAGRLGPKGPRRPGGWIYAIWNDF